MVWLFHIGRMQSSSSLYSQIVKNIHAPSSYKDVNVSLSFSVSKLNILFINCQAHICNFNILWAFLKQQKNYPMDSAIQPSHNQL